MRSELFRLFEIGFPAYFVLLLSGFLFATAQGALWARRIIDRMLDKERGSSGSAQAAE